MKRIFTLITALMFGLSTLTQARSVSFKVLQQHTKKDGTPDRRFKENKKHLKKDGTPDMRYKANNPNAGKKKKK